jgi:hypothetical protein
MRAIRVLLIATSGLGLAALVSPGKGATATPISHRRPPSRLSGLRLPAAVFRPCSQERRLRSLNSKVPTMIGFRNRTSRPVAMFWLNYSGQREFYENVQPRATWFQQTYATHPWIAASAPNDRCKAIFIASARTTEADIR